MIISIVNYSKISEEEIQSVIRAINRQIEEDFRPYWNRGAILRLEGHAQTNPDEENPDGIRGDAIIYLSDESSNFPGYHTRNTNGTPFGYVFTEVSKKLGEDWSVMLSHEALELIGDPEVNLLVAGPHPTNPKIQVFHWYEMCDAVQDESYEIDGVRVSNFVLPLYFTHSEERTGRNDFLGTVNKEGKRLHSFGINEGGNAGFYNPATGEMEMVFGGTRAEERMKIKSAGNIARRSSRYASLASTTETAPFACNIQGDVTFKVKLNNRIIASNTKTATGPAKKGENTVLYDIIGPIDTEYTLNITSPLSAVRTIYGKLKDHFPVDITQKFTV